MHEPQDGAAALRKDDRAKVVSGGMSNAGPSWLRPLISALSPGGARARLTILIFHRVHERPDALFPDEMHAVSFRQRMEWIRGWFNVLPLDEAIEGLASGLLPARALAISFDDGYADNATVALPILRQLGLPATFFIASGFLNGGRMWNDTVIETIRRVDGELNLERAGLGVHRLDSMVARRSAIAAILPRLKYLEPGARDEKVAAIAAVGAQKLPDDLMLSSEQLRSLSLNGMSVGAHTVNHPILARIDGSTAQREMADSRDALAAIVRQPIRLFAYPNGKPGVDYRSSDAEIANRVGFTAAVSTGWGAGRVDTSRFELPRFTPWDRGAARFGLRLVRNLAHRAVSAADIEHRPGVARRASAS